MGVRRAKPSSPLQTSTFLIRACRYRQARATQANAIQLRATHNFVDVLGVERKAGEEYIITHNQTPAFIPGACACAHSTAGIQWREWSWIVGYRGTVEGSGGLSMTASWRGAHAPKPNSAPSMTFHDLSMTASWRGAHAPKPNSASSLLGAPHLPY